MRGRGVRRVRSLRTEIKDYLRDDDNVSNDNI